MNMQFNYKTKLNFKSKAALLILSLSLVFGACKKTTIIEYIEAGKTDGDGGGTTTKSIVEIPAGNILVNTKWTKDKVYRINGFVRVGRDAKNTQSLPAVENITLEIEAGTTIIGDRESKGTLVVQRGNKILAEGTASAPIIFTSERAPGFREPGDWGGLVICGKAVNNQPNGEAELEGNYGAWHGGTANTDNSGVIKYVRIEYAGTPINPNQEVNSLTMGSVGSATVVDYVQCSYGLDDAFEWFGGTVNAKHLIAYRGLDDDFDVDFGYNGKVQFAIGIRDANAADQSGSNGFEVDNDGTGSAASPFTSGTFSNMTIIGPKKDKDKTISVQFQNALHLRRNNKLKIHNSVFTGYPNGLYIDGSTTLANAASGDLVFKNNVLAGVNGWGDNGYGTGGSVNFPNPKGSPIISNGNIGAQTVVEWFNTTAFGNQSLPKWEDMGIDGSIFDLGATPKLTPNTGSILLSGANFTGLSGFETVTYRGAFGTTDWSTGWASFTPQQNVYL
ncbi:Ig-like domain repeat protein [Pedobacter cryotolerans]|uniref:Ig-like domain repeat protein n=1 Tax=Pedobacter cryotolerans TaxID=2571270 RepID=A0A4U1C316_9SPHI|nr:Ig-like domain repeat protein [Pedobacter cryotolerans]TKB99448.1 Ig-like domain repeat protein [Pedobacter cryotolerans]